MTIDERLQALAESTELIARMHQKTEKELRRLTHETRRFMRTAQLIFLNHETRLGNLEGIDDEDDEDDETNK